MPESLPFVPAVKPGFPENTQPDPVVALIWNPPGQYGVGTPVLKS